MALITTRPLFEPTKRQSSALDALSAMSSTTRTGSSSVVAADANDLERPSPPDS